MREPDETQVNAGQAADDTPFDLRAGKLRVRLARTADEIDAAYRLRYRVFYDEMRARPSPEKAASKRDTDEFDPYCEHLLVIDTDIGDGPDGVVGTYRMMRRSGAAKVGRFYTADEYDISPLVALDGEILEMGRSCIDADHRTRATMQLLWRGVTAYVLANDVTCLFGCASIHGTDPASMALPLSYLYHNHLAPENVRPVALRERYVDMNLMPPDAIDMRQALKTMPPMIKGYLRLNGMIGDGAVVDHDFNTVDVCIVVLMDVVSKKYLKHFLRDLTTSAS